MDLSSPLGANLNGTTKTILADAPEPECPQQRNGVMLAVNALVRSAQYQGLYIHDDSTSEISEGFIDLVVDEAGGVNYSPVAAANLNKIVKHVTAEAAAHGVVCHVQLHVHFSYNPKEQS
jgi:hypothetical protein